MNKWQPIINLAGIMLLFVTAVYFGFSYVGNMIVKRNKEKKTVALTGRVEMRQRKALDPKYQEFVKVATELKLGRDPFVMEKIVQPVVVVEEVVPEEGPLLLQGIMWEDNNPKAMINGEVLEIGSFIDHYMVVDIEKEQVILIDNDPTLPARERTIELRLSTPE